MSQQEFGPTFEPEPIPAVLTFRLPDDTLVKSSQDTAEAPIDIELGGELLCSFVPQSRALRISPHGIVNPERAESASVLRLVLVQNRTSISYDDLWGALYGLWLRKAEDDVTPFELSDDIEKAAELRNYLSQLSVGLAELVTYFITQRPPVWHSPHPTHKAHRNFFWFGPPSGRVRAPPWQGIGCDHPLLTHLCPRYARSRSSSRSLAVSMC